MVSAGVADRVGIERLCVFGMPPVPFVELAAELDCRYIGIGLVAMRYCNPHGYPDWSLKHDPVLRRETLAALRDHDVTIALCEGFGIRRGFNARELASDLDVVRELGGERINAVSIDPDLSRTLDEFAILAEMAAARGIETVIEIGPGPISGLAPAMAAVSHVQQPYFKILLDTMHFFRLGGSIAEIAGTDPDVIGYVQFCDAPLESTCSSYMEEALHERMVPGTGQLPLAELLALIPRDVIVSVEVPQRALAEAGVEPRERVSRSVRATRRLLAERATRSSPGRTPGRRSTEFRWTE